MSLFQICMGTCKLQPHAMPHVAVQCLPPVPAACALSTAIIDDDDDDDIIMP
jgi:hypothetical protein